MATHYSLNVGWIIKMMGNTQSDKIYKQAPSTANNLFPNESMVFTVWYNVGMFTLFKFNFKGWDDWLYVLFHKFGWIVYQLDKNLNKILTKFRNIKVCKISLLHSTNA